MDFIRLAAVTSPDIILTCARNNHSCGVGRCLQYKEALEIQLQKARRHHERALLARVVRAWADAAAEEKIASWRNERVAREHDLQ